MGFSSLRPGGGWPKLETVANSANSYLIRKLEGRADIVGHQMPPPPALSSEVQAIRQWIDQGAQNN